MPFCVPVREDENGGAGVAVARGKELSVDGVVFGPGGVNGAGESEDVIVFKRGRRAADVEAIVRGRSGGVPVVAILDGARGVIADEVARVGFMGRTADMLEAPVERLDATIVVSGPATVLIAADFAFEEVHEKADR